MGFLLRHAMRTTGTHKFDELSDIAAAAVAYQVQYGTFPTGTTQEVCRKLSGDNPRNISFVHSTEDIGIDEDGRFLDAWDRPYSIFFSDNAVLIRSRGKDGKVDDGHFFEADDIILSRTVDERRNVSTADSNEPSSTPVTRIVPEQVINEWGYRTVAGSVQQPDWETEAFSKALVRIQAIKGIDKLPEWDTAHYRFTIVEEVFETEQLASSRIARLRDHDPRLDSKRTPELVLRSGFSIGCKVLYVTTDVLKFEIEQMPALVKSLRTHFLETSRINGNFRE